MKSPRNNTYYLNTDAIVCLQTYYYLEVLSITNGRVHRIIYICKLAGNLVWTKYFKYLKYLKLFKMYTMASSTMDIVAVSTMILKALKMRSIRKCRWRRAVMKAISCHDQKGHLQLQIQQLSVSPPRAPLRSIHRSKLIPIPMHVDFLLFRILNVRQSKKV